MQRLRAGRVVDVRNLVPSGAYHSLLQSDALSAGFFGFSKSGLAACKTLAHGPHARGCLGIPQGLPQVVSSAWNDVYASTARISKRVAAVSAGSGERANDGP